MAVAWNTNSGQFYPPYFLSAVPLNEEVPEIGKEGAFVNLPFTPIHDSKPLPEISTTKPKHTSIIVPMANLNRAFEPVAPFPRWPNDQNDDTTDPTGSTRIGDHIEHLSFQTFSYDAEAELDANKIVPQTLANVSLPTPDPDWGNFPYLLYPLMRCQINPDKPRRYTSAAQVLSDYGIAHFPEIASYGYLGDAYPVTYGKVKGGGWLAGMLWHTKNDTPIAIPKWSQSPLLCGINPTTGSLAWDVKGWQEFSETGPSVYELYTTILVLGDQLLVHYERFELNQVTQKAVDPLKRQAFDDWFNCRPTDSHHDTIHGNGEDQVFDLAADWGFHERGKGIIDDYAKHHHPRVFINGCQLTNDVRPSFVNFTTGVNGSTKVQALFAEKLPDGVTVDIHYSVWRDCMFDDPMLDGGTFQSSDTGGFYVNCCGSDQTGCWWKDLHVCDAATLAPGGCPYTSQGDDWHGGQIAESYDPHCRTCVDILAPDQSFVDGVLNRLGPKVAEMIDDTQVTLQTPVKWTHGHRWYNAQTGTKISDTPYRLRTCIEQPKMYASFAAFSDSTTVAAEAGDFTLPATIPNPEDPDGPEIPNPAYPKRRTIEPPGFASNQFPYWLVNIGQTYIRQRRPYQGCGCLAGCGCLGHWGNDVSEAIGVDLGSRILIGFGGPQFFIDPVDMLRPQPIPIGTATLDEDFNCTPGPTFSAMITIEESTRTIKRWGILATLENATFEQSIKAPHLTWNAVAMPDGKGVYFLPGHGFPEGPDTGNTTPGVEEPSGREPFIIDLSPEGTSGSSLPVGGGGPVNIFGRNFIGATQVYFGAISVSFTVQDKFNIRVPTIPNYPGTLPPFEPRYVAVTVVTPEGTSNEKQFSYFYAPGGDGGDGGLG